MLCVWPSTHENSEIEQTLVHGHHSVPFRRRHYERGHDYAHGPIETSVIAPADFALPKESHMHVDVDRSVPKPFQALRVFLLSVGVLAGIWGLLTFGLDSLPGEWVTGATFLVFGALAVVMSGQLLAGTRSRDIVVIETLFMTALATGGAVVEQEWITPLLLIVPLVVLTLIFSAPGKQWYATGTSEQSRD
jgi:hypothetical protein